MFGRAIKGDGINRDCRYEAGASLSGGSEVDAPGSDDREARSSVPIVRFVNTYRPVVPLYETVAAVAESMYGWRVVACMSRGIYRSAGEAGFVGNASVGTQLVWVPDLLCKSSMGSNLLFFLLAPFTLMKNPQSDLNVFLTHPPLFYVLGGALSRRSGVPYFIHLMDLYPDILQQAGWLAEDSPSFRLLARLSLHALQKATGIVVIGRCMGERLIAKGIDPVKVHFVPTCSSQQIHPVNHSQNRFRERFGLKDKFVVMYSGNMGLLHELDTLLLVARSLANDDDIHFVFVGNGRRRELVQAAIARGARNISLLDYQADGEALAHSLSAADVHFVSLREGYEGLVVPSKFYGALAAGRPVIYEGASNGEVARVIHSTGCGVVVRPGDAAALRVTITSLQSDRERREKLGAIALQVHREHYEPTIVARTYCRAISGPIAAAKRDR